MCISILALWSILCFPTSLSADIANNTSYVRTIYKNTNIRKGPGYDYPVFFKIKNTKNYPLKELILYGDWIKVVDFENSTGWVYKNLVTHKKNSIIFINPSYIYSKPKTSSKKIALIGKYNTAIIIKKEKDFLMVFINGIKGWVKKKDCWGYN